MPVDMDAVIAAAQRTGTALEINASLFRLDLKDVLARAAGEAGVALACNTDAHAINDFDHMRYGVLTARRAWLRREQVVNAWPLGRLRAFAKHKRG
jgi:DNA polymerase (family 10)